MYRKEPMVGIINDLSIDAFILDNRESNIGVDPHWHDCFEILYILEGRARQIINNIEFKTEKGDVVIIKQGDVHETYCDKDIDCKILVVKFLPAIFNTLNGSLNEFLYIFSFLNMEKSPIYHLVPDNPWHVQLVAVMNSMNEEFIKESVGFELIIRGYFYQMLALLIRSQMINIVNTEESCEADKENMALITEYVKSHISEQVNLSQIADLLHLNYSYCSRYFKKLTGNNFKNYIQFVRICEAERLIVTKGVSITKAAYSCGFPDVSSFGKAYRKIRGCSPSHLKK